MSLGLVLGGGGVAAVAWEAGVIAGLAEAGVRLSGASGPQRIVGTSAGAIVGAACGSDPDGAGLERLLEAGGGPGPPPHADGQSGKTEIDRYRAFVAGLLSRRSWPQGVDLRVTAVDADTGAVRAFDAGSGVGMEDAIAASCALPGRFPAVAIGGRRYTDGGAVSATHADLAAGCSEVLVIAPHADPGGGSGFDAEIARLGDGVRSAVVVPDAPSRAAFGTDPLDTSARLLAAEAGRAQGRAEALRIGIMLSL